MGKFAFVFQQQFHGAKDAFFLILFLKCGQGVTVFTITDWIQSVQGLGLQRKSTTTPGAFFLCVKNEAYTHIGFFGVLRVGGKKFFIIICKGLAVGGIHFHIPGGIIKAELTFSGEDVEAGQARECLNNIHCLLLVYMV